MAIGETLILKAFIDKREDFEKFGPYVLSLKNMERNVRTMLGFIKKFYEKYPDANDIPEVEFRVFVDGFDMRNFIGNNDQYIKSVYQTPLTNVDLKMDVIEGAIERHFMSEVVDKAALVLDQNKSGILSTCQDIIDEFHTLLRRPPTKDIVEYKLDLDKLIKDEVTTNGVPFCNPKPNSVIRGMRAGQLGLIYAYVDTGKTSYGVSNLCSVASHLSSNNVNRPVIYGANEEDVSRVTLRAIQCITNWTSDEIEQHKLHVPAILQKHGFDRMKFFDHVNNMRVVESLLVKYNPQVMFIDQGTKVQMAGSKREGVGLLEEIFNTYRDLAKRHKCTIVCMAQGGEDCFKKKYPDLRDLYGSKSAIQGELDWAIAIGEEPDDVKYKDWRYFHISKNKGDKATYACRFDSKRCQFTEAV